eukprot:g538.t1
MAHGAAPTCGANRVTTTPNYNGPCVEFTSAKDMREKVEAAVSAQASVAEQIYKDVKTWSKEKVEACEYVESCDPDRTDPAWDAAKYFAQFTNPGTQTCSRRDWGDGNKAGNPMLKDAITGRDVFGNEGACSGYSSIGGADGLTKNTIFSNQYYTEKGCFRADVKTKCTVNPEKYGVNMPTGKFIKESPQAQSEVCATNALVNHQSGFKAVQDKYPEITWSFLGLQATGLFRNWPAIYQCRTESQCDGCSDSRFRGWYASAAAGPKDLILVMDRSGSMLAKGRLTEAQKAARWVINTLSYADYATIVDFSTDANTIGPMMPMHVENRARMKKYVNTMSAFGGTRLDRGIVKALDLLKEGKASGKTTNCESIILFLTDGKNTGSSPTALVREKAAELSVRIFTYHFGESDDTAGQQVMKTIACENSGVYYNVPVEGGNLKLIMASYFSFLAVGLIQGAQAGAPNPVLWAETYEDGVTVDPRVKNQYHVVAMDVMTEQFATVLHQVRNKTFVNKTQAENAKGKRSCPPPGGDTGVVMAFALHDGTILATTNLKDMNTVTSLSGDFRAEEAQGGDRLAAAVESLNEAEQKQDRNVFLKDYGVRSQFSLLVTLAAVILATTLASLGLRSVLQKYEQRVKAADANTKAKQAVENDLRSIDPDSEDFFDVFKNLAMPAIARTNLKLRHTSKKEMDPPQAFLDLLKIVNSEQSAADLFKKMDKDGGGTITRDEFNNVLRDLGVKHVQDDAIQSLFDALDVDGGGTISYQEVIEGDPNRWMGPNKDYIMLIPISAVLRPNVFMLRFRSVGQAGTNLIETLFFGKDVLALFLAFMVISTTIGVVILHEGWYDSPDRFETLPTAIITIFIFLLTGENYPDVAYDSSDCNQPNLPQTDTLEGGVTSADCANWALHPVFWLFSMLGLFLVVALVIAVFEGFYGNKGHEQATARRKNRRLGIIAAFVLLDKDGGGSLDKQELLGFLNSTAGLSFKFEMDDELELDGIEFVELVESLSFWFVNDDFYMEFRNRYDFMIVLAEFLAIIPMLVMYFQGTPDAVGANLQLRFIFCLPTLRLLSCVSMIREIFFSMLAILPQSKSVFALLALVMYMYNIFGLMLFNGRFRFLGENYEMAQANFNSFVDGFTTLFQLFVGAAWNEILQAAMDTANPVLVPFVVLYFFSYILIMTVVFSNLLIGVVITSG